MTSHMKCNFEQSTEVIKEAYMITKKEVGNDNDRMLSFLEDIVKCASGEQSSTNENVLLMAGLLNKDKKSLLGVMQYSKDMKASVPIHTIKNDNKPLSKMERKHNKQMMKLDAKMKKSQDEFDNMMVFLLK